MALAFPLLQGIRPRKGKRYSTADLIAMYNILSRTRNRSPQFPVNLTLDTTFQKLIAEGWVEFQKKYGARTKIMETGDSTEPDTTGDDVFTCKPWMLIDNARISTYSCKLSPEAEIPCGPRLTASTTLRAPFPFSH